MASTVQDIPLNDIDWDSLDNSVLQDIIDNDERSTAQDKAKTLLEERTATPQHTEDYDPRQDPGPVRPEDEISTYPEGWEDPVRHEDYPEN